MNIQAIRTIARDHGIKPLPPTKMELVRTIQRCEGNFPCYGKALDGRCDQGACLWREDCLTKSASSRHRMDRQAGP